MDIILLQKVANLGQIGDRVKVKSGYARNFLVPTGRATMATAANIAKFEAERHLLEAKANEELAAAQARALKFENCSVRSAPPTSPRRPSTPVSRSAAAKCACRLGRSAPRASTKFSCTCTPMWM